MYAGQLCQTNTFSESETSVAATWPSSAGAQDVAAEEDPELAENQLIFPNADTLSKSKAFRSLTGQEEQRFASAWQNLLLGA